MTDKNIQAAKLTVTKADMKKSSGLDSAKVVRNEFSAKWSDHKIIRDQNNNLFVKKEQRVESEKACKKVVLESKRRMNLNYGPLQKMCDWSCKAAGTMCYSFWNMSTYFEEPESDLQKEFVARTKTDQGWSSNELVHVAYQMLDALSWLNRNGLAFQNLRPEFVGVRSSQENQYMLLDRLGANSDAVQAATQHWVHNDLLYMSPVLFEGISLKKGKIVHDVVKSDAWSLGLVLLEAGLAGSVQEIYDRKSGSVDVGRLQDLLNALKHTVRCGHQDEVLPVIVEHLLVLDEGARLAPHELLRSLPPYQQFWGNPCQPVMVCDEPRVIVKSSPCPMERVIIEQEPRVDSEMRERIVSKEVVKAPENAVRRVVMTGGDHCHPGNRVIQGEPIVRRVTGEGHHVQHHGQGEVVRRVVGEERVVEGGVHHGHGEVVRRVVDGGDHHHGEVVVRRAQPVQHVHEPLHHQEPMVVRRVVDGEVHEGNHHQGEHVVRRSFMQHGNTVHHGESYVQGHGNRVFHGEPMVRRVVEGDHYGHHGGEQVVSRVVEGGHSFGHHNGEPMVRRVVDGGHSYGHHDGGNVVTRVVEGGHSYGHHDGGNVVTRVVDGGHHHGYNEGVVRRVVDGDYHHGHHNEGVVRRVVDGHHNEEVVRRVVDGGSFHHGGDNLVRKASVHSKKSTHSP